MKKLIRIYHPWNLWEDYKHNFYGPKKSNNKEPEQTYAEVLRDIPLFAATLNRIIKEWKYSCEHNLSNTSLNRVAYLGQAACAFLFEVPSVDSQGGYNLLTEYEKHAADSVALYYLNLWLVRNGYEHVSFEEEIKSYSIRSNEGQDNDDV